MHEVTITYKSGTVKTLICEVFETETSSDGRLTKVRVEKYDTAKSGAPLFWGLNSVESIWSQEI